MPLILSGNVASATADAGYNIANSVRYNPGDAPNMALTFGTPTDNLKWTWSGWIKKCFHLSGDARIISDVYAASPGRGGGPWIMPNDFYRMRNWHTDADKGNLTTNQKLRDVSAWYHIVQVYDSANATAGNRMRLYINGVEVTSFSTDTNPDEDQATAFNKDGEGHQIGSYRGIASYFDGYLAEIVFIDGQALAPTSFGEFNSDSPTIWQPIDPSGLTFGDNGYWLDFENSSAFGNDVSGNDNDWTPANLAATDQCTDTPTNNFCTVNPLDDFYQDAGFTEGNCKLTFKGTQSLYAYSTGTFGVSGGKWYWENKATSAGNHDNYGIVGRLADATSTLIGRNTDNYGYYNYNGKYSNAATDGTYREVDFSGGNVTWTTNDIIGIALDMDNDTVSFYKNNALTGTIDIIAPSTGFYYPAWNQVDGDAEVVEVNFGNPSYALTSAAADENGYGAFEYAPPSGFLALCTKNLGSDGG